jgi:hypothetical protein
MPGLSERNPLKGSRDSGRVRTSREGNEALSNKRKTKEKTS